MDFPKYCFIDSVVIRFHRVEVKSKISSNGFFFNKINIVDTGFSFITLIMKVFLKFVVTMKYFFKLSYNFNRKSCLKN